MNTRNVLLILLSLSSTSMAQPAWSPARAIHDLLGLPAPQMMKTIVTTKSPASAGILRIGSAPNCVGNVAGGASSGTTLPVDATGANMPTLIDLVVSGNSSLSIAVGDSQTNTYTPLTRRIPPSSPDAQQFFVLHPSTSGTMTFTVTGTFTSMCVLMFSGVTSLDSESGFGTPTAVATLQPGSITPTVANSLFVTSCSLGSPTTVTAGDLGAGFTQAGFLDFTSGHNYGVCVAYLIQSGVAAAVNPTWGATATALSAVTMAVFKP